MISVQRIFIKSSVWQMEMEGSWENVLNKAWIKFKYTATYCCFLIHSKLHENKPYCAKLKKIKYTLSDYKGSIWMLGEGESALVNTLENDKTSWSTLHGYFC